MENQIESLKICVITTCNTDFEKYRKSQPEKIKPLLRKITRLSDLKQKEYAKAVLLSESKNVTDYLIKEAKAASQTFEDLSQNIFY